MTVLITGGAGFIGSNFIYYYLKTHPEDRVVCLDALTYAGNLSTLDAAMKHPNFKFHRADICSRGAVFRIFEKERPEIVINFAAESHVDRSIADPGIFLRTNVLGTQVLMDACLRYGVRRFHQVSTDEVYGDLPLDRPDQFFTEQTPLCAGSPYSASKAAVPLMIVNALNDEPLPVYGSGENVRDWLYVDDHCRAIDRIVHDGTEGEIYNVGGHNEMRNIDVVRLILQKLGKPESLITYVTDRKGHDLRYAIDPTKIIAELGWQPETTFADGLDRTIDWYLTHRQWWEDILSGAYRMSYDDTGF